MTGFKSFANKTVLDLEPGITGVVGPNGSGKSNLADAVRWALGEQSKGRLRLGDREEVVFAGTAKRAKASFAEVVLLFDNQDGAFPLDLTEVEIARRLYRSGETDYRLAGRSVRLSDIQALLAQAGFGANTYAVIGQGMIDSFLLSSPAERKLLFDEAAGIRGPELNREAALRKLTATTGNLTRLRDIASELTPRLASLERSVAAADEQHQLEAHIASLRTNLIQARQAATIAEHETLTRELTNTTAQVHRLRHDAAAIKHRLAATARAAEDEAREREELQQSLSVLERERDQLVAEQARSRVTVAEAERNAEQLTELADRLAAVHTQHATLEVQRAETSSQLATNTAAAERAAKAVDRATREVAAAQAELVELRKDSLDGTRDQYVDHALQILKALAVDLNAGQASNQQIRLLVHKAGRLLSHASRSGADELLAKLRSAQKSLENAMTKRETAIEHQTNITITQRSLEIDLVHQSEAVAGAAEQLAYHQAKLTAAHAATEDLNKLEQQVTEAGIALERATAELDRRREQVRHHGADAKYLQLQMELSADAQRTTDALEQALQQQVVLRQAAANMRSELAAIRRQARQWAIPADIAISPAHPEASSTRVHLAPASMAKLTDELARAEARHEALAVVRQDQAAEYEEVRARHLELTEQIRDLEDAHANLQQLVIELDGLIRERFTENFQALAEQFAIYFERLFPGGSASLELEEAEVGDYGIAIKASPAGKRLASLAALSGGERALAGVALLAAILRVNPSPFVVLDEIDAALDEANSGRLADILAELKEHSQLIVITHNRQTMKVASVLFGVTINEHHVSHLLSMRLAEATQLAAR